MHWRWSQLTPNAFFNPGKPLIPPGSDQALDVGLALVKLNENDNELHPEDYGFTLNEESIRNGDNRKAAVFWYSSTGFKDTDKFFWNPAWFNSNPNVVSQNLVVENASGPVQDGPVSVDLGNVYVAGATAFEPFDLTQVGPLPPGYQALNNAYLITNDGLISGPHAINFSAASVQDSTTFSHLRIFHAESDAFDPERPVWVDRTILPPGTPAPNFSNKSLSAVSENLGVFVVAKLVQAIPPSTNAADLAVSCVDSADPIVGGNNLTYTITVTNNGPNVATDVALVDSPSVNASAVSFSASQGSCKAVDGNI
jgi:uncharacterized repeat protein (TIGR01451 family)